MSPRDGQSQAAIEKPGRRCLLIDLARTGLFGPQSHHNPSLVYHPPANPDNFQHVCRDSTDLT